MPLVFIAKIKGDEKAIEASTHEKMEAEVKQRITIWEGVIKDSAATSAIHLACATLLVISTALIFIPTTVIAIVIVILYHVRVDFAYNPLAGRWFAKRQKRKWEVELARIQNPDSRLPYKKLPTEP